MGSKLHKPVVTFEEVDKQLAASGESLESYQDLFSTLSQQQRASRLVIGFPHSVASRVSTWSPAQGAVLMCTSILR